MMFRPLVSTARRQRFVALLGVIALALAVPPAFGASSVTTQIAKALKLAKTANTNASKALTVAKAATAGTPGAAGAKGATGAAGAAGANGTAGPAGVKGDTGSAGPKGDKGDAGATGATGATGAQGIQGPPGPAGTTAGGGSAGAAYVASVSPTTGTSLPVDAAPVTILSKHLPAGTYVINGRAQMHGTGSGATYVCQLVSSSAAPTDDPLDEVSAGKFPSGYDSDVPLQGSITLASAADISIVCHDSTGDGAAGNFSAISAKITAIAVASLN